MATAHPAVGSTLGGVARPVAVAPPRVGRGWWAAGVVALAGAAVVATAVGTVPIPPAAVAGELLDHLPWLDVDSGLSARESAIVWDIRFPRVVLALVVGAMLSIAGASYQGAFRNPLADPWLLGAAAGAGLGVTAAIALRSADAATPVWVPLAGFAGALGAVLLTYLLGAAGSGTRLTPASLVLAGVAVASFLTALQTFLQQRNQDTLREVYSFILGQVSTAGWREVAIVLPYVVVSTAVLLVHRRALDVLSVGDEEAGALGLDPRRTRLVVVAAASLGTAAAVAVAGLIAFVGIIVPHTVRLLAGASLRVVLPLSLLFGGAFLALADLVARTALSPAEVPLGVVTAFFGAPFFVVVLRTSRRGLG